MQKFTTRGSYITVVENEYNIHVLYIC